MNKLRFQIVGAFLLFLLLAVGSTALFYSHFAEDYYLAQKKKAILYAFETLSQMELQELQDEGSILPLEEENFTIIICNEQLEAVYYSKTFPTQNTIKVHFEDKLEFYTTTPSVLHNSEKRFQPLQLFGIIPHDEEKFYVYIYESTRSLHNTILYTSQILQKLFLFLLVSGFLFTFSLANWIIRPVLEIQNAAKKLANNDFSVRLPIRHPKNELSQLAMDINQMSDKLQRDMNELSNYNYLLLRQNRNMAEFEDMRKKLVSTFTHELKTPLAIISSQLELMQYEYDADKKDYYYSSIMEEIDKMSKMISTILRNSKLENQLSQIELRWLNLSELLFELLPKYQNWLSSKKLHFTSSIEDDCVAYIDRTQIEQVLNNYLMNAVRHTKAGRTVRILLKSEEEFIYLSVYNDGPRLPVKELDRIWTGFYQSGNSPSNHGTEFGLGLYIVKDIMRQHGGSCGVQNQKNGVEFWIRLPKSQI